MSERIKEIENNNENIPVRNNISDGYLLTFKILLFILDLKHNDKIILIIIF